MHAIFVAGTAGSGKSLLTSSLQRWFLDRSQNAISLNLDPGAGFLPYEPDVDVREMVEIESIMKNYELGPNGALVFAADLIASRMGELQTSIDSLNPNYLIIDTPGQIELFAFRESGPFIVDELAAESKILVFLIDSLLATSAANFISLALLSASVQLRMNIPQIPVLSKVDMKGGNVKQILDWSKDAALFEETLSKIKSGGEYLLYSQLFRSLRKVAFSVDLYPVSSVTLDGFVALVGEISRIAKQGEEME